MKKVLSVALAMTLAVGLLTACQERGDEEILLPEESKAPLDFVQPEEPKTPSQMETEEQLREGLEALQDEPDRQADRLAFYEELLARDLCRKEDYLEMAQLYAEAGDAEAQRRMLWWGFRLYPSEEYVRRLEESIVNRTGEDEAAGKLIGDLRQALTDQDAAALRSVVKSEDWAEIFQELPEVYATRTRYQSGGLMAQIVSDAYETEVFLLAADGACLYGRLNEAGSLIGAAVYADGAYNGDAAVCWFDEKDVCYKKYQATLVQNVCVDSVSVEYEGISYLGALGEDGATVEQQQEKVTQAGGVVYAYQVGGRRYLYQEGVSPETFRMDYSIIGLPTVDIWE